MFRVIKSNFVFFVISLSYVLLIPAFAQAQSGFEKEVNRLTNVLTSFDTIVFYLTAITISLVFLFFVWNIVLFIKQENKREKVVERLVWGVVAVFVLTSVWGLVYLLRLTVFGGGEGSRDIQTIRLPVGTLGDK